jgi:catechol 2,3-dioxygenase-like lactoylglutathione lyase family enzyme
MSLSPKTPGVHHLALRAADLARSRRFYTDLLGYPVVLEAPNIFLFVAGGTVVAVRGPEKDTPPNDRFNPFRVGLDHVALGCLEEAELHRVAAGMAKAGVPNTGVKLDEALGKQYVAFKDPDGIAWELYMMERPSVAAAEAYLRGLKTRDLSGVPFAEEIVFESPLTDGVLRGRKAVEEFLAGVFPVILDVKPKQHVAEGEFVALRFDLETTYGTVPVFDFFRVVGGKIVQIRPYYDPRPITNAAARPAAAGATP